MRNKSCCKVIVGQTMPDKKMKSFPQVVGGNLPHTKSLIKRERQSCLIREAVDVRVLAGWANSGMTNGARRRGFTLIELLVVVLIIGILAAVAVPQYQKAVWRSRNTQFKQLMHAVRQAEEAYFMANGNYADNFDELGIDLPLAEVTTREGQSVSPCAIAVQGTDSVRQGDNFQLVLNHVGEKLAIVGRYTKGPYKCAGFTWSFTGGLLCAERETLMPGKPGDFCIKLEKGILLRSGSSNAATLYTLP